MPSPRSSANTTGPTAAAKRRGPRQARAAAAGAAERPDRKLAIILAAEKLFAHHGFHAVTLRQIAEEAGVPLALVDYYYGTKRDLFVAIFARWQPTIDARLTALAAVPDEPANPATLTRIVEAFVQPVLRLRASAEGEFYALLVARELHHSREETDAVMAACFDPLARAFIARLHAALPQATLGEVAWGYQFALGALLTHISDHRVQRLSQGHNQPGDPAAAPLLVAFICGGLRAALPATPAATAPTATPHRPPAKTRNTKPTTRRPA